jgi:hypothetical protein
VRGRGVRHRHASPATEGDEHALACNAVLAELPEPRPGQLAAEAPAAAAEIGPENDKADILAWLINYLPGSLVPEAASISIALQDEALRAETLLRWESSPAAYRAHSNAVLKALRTVQRWWPPPAGHPQIAARARLVAPFAGRLNALRDRHRTRDW